MLTCKKQCFRGFDITVFTVSASACEYPVGERDTFIDDSTARTHLCRREEPAYYKDIWIGHQLALQRPECAVLHLSSKQSLMPPSDILILDDYKLSSFRDVMVCLIGLCPPSVGKLLVFPPDEMLRVIPAPGILLLAGELLLQALEAFRFSDCYFELLTF